MGRWRAPRPSASPYITQQGFDRLQKELEELWGRRASVVKALAAAAAEGDRSENAEYIYRKKELGGIDRRIRYLQKRMPALNVVNARPEAERVFFGAWIALRPDDGDSVEYRIVGADETDMDDAYISIDSPLAQSLLKKCPGEVVEMTAAGKQRRLTIAAIRYD